jgi:hypothetical protein
VIALTVAVLHAAAESPGLSFIRTEDLKAWVSYLASDELGGRGNYSAGLDLAAEYIQQHLRDWGVTPAGDAGGFLQLVRVTRVRSRSRSSVTVQGPAGSRTFRDGDGVTFPAYSGGSQKLTLNRVVFTGYGLHAPSIAPDDFRDTDVHGKATIWLGADGPRGVDTALYHRVLAQRTSHALENLGARAAIGPAPDVAPSARDREFVAAGRLDTAVPPAIVAGDAFFEFLFRNAPVRYPELRRLAANRDPLPHFELNGVTITFDVNMAYEVLSTETTRNVVGIVPGTDPALQPTYVAFGAHYDHVGQTGTNGSPPGRVAPGAADDRIWNGADDDATGTAAVMALARAFSAGPRPKRSTLFVWHAGEELGNYGSRHFTDFPPVPIDSVVAQLNLDMIGRNRNDDVSQANRVYLVGSDRISSELHEISREANRALPAPMHLDYEMNAPSDPEQLYYRSDHYSYAAKGIPVIFFTTGLHPDYHANTDEASKILYDKMTRVVQLVYETGLRLANLDRPPVRDRRGPRAGKDSPE